MPELYKVIVVGDSGVGKSALVSRLKTPVGALPDSQPTVGTDTASFTCTVPGSEPDQRVVLSIWDTAGQERFRALTAGFYRNAAAVVFVYDITNGGSFASLASVWLAETDLYGPSNAVRVLVGNKSDLTKQPGVHEWRDVSGTESRAFAERHGMLWYECSAKCDGPAIQQLFEDIALSILTRSANVPLSASKHLTLDAKPGTFACCS